MWSVALDLAIFFFGVVGLGGIFARGPHKLISALILGQILLYLLWLGSLDIQLCATILKFTALIGFGVWLTSWQMTSSLFCFFFLGMLMLANPIFGWDERFVWAFNAKVLHTFSGSAVFEQLIRPEFWIAHPENPKLFAVLAATVTAHRPWGAYFPKVAMIALWLPIFLLLWRLSLPVWKRLFIIIVALTCTGSLVFTAYLDPVLAMCFFVGTWTLFLEPRLRREAILLLSLLPLMKYEGLLMLGIVGAGYLLSLWKNSKLRSEWKSLLWFTPAAICVLAWKFRCHTWGLGSYYTADPQSFLTHFLERAMNPHSYWIVLRSLIQANRILFELIVIAAVCWWLQPRSKRAPLYGILAIAFIYALCLFPIYFGTPFDIHWHIQNSIDRTTLPFYLLAFGTLIMGLPRASRD